MKKVLILRASEDIEKNEVEIIKSQVQLYGMGADVKDIFTLGELHSALYCNEKYDYIYLASHGCEESWGNISGSIQVTWIEFAAHICMSEITKPGTIFFHSCCKGGLEKVFYDMFACCDKIQLVCGPRFNVKPNHLVMAFTLFLYNIEVREVDPIHAAEKVLSAIDLRLSCFDRLDCVHTPNYKNYCESVKDKINDAFSGRLFADVELASDDTSRYEEIIVTADVMKPQL